MFTAVLKRESSSEEALKQLVALLNNLLGFSKLKGNYLREKKSDSSFCGLLITHERYKVGLQGCMSIVACDCSSL